MENILYFTYSQANSESEGYLVGSSEIKWSQNYISLGGKILYPKQNIIEARYS